MCINRRKLAIVLFTLSIITLVVTTRIWWVNTNTDNASVIYYGVGDWIDLDEGVSDEDLISINYQFKVQGVEIMSPNQYLARYSTDGIKSIDSIDSNDACVAVVQMTIRNAGQDRGGVDAFVWRLVPKSNDIDYALDSALLGHMDRAASSGSFAIRPGTEYVVFLPFSGEIDGPYFSPSGSKRRPIINQDEFRLSLTRDPIQRTVNLI